MNNLLGMISYILIWSLLLIPLFISITPNRVEKAYLKNKYSNYNNLKFKDKIKVLKLYRLEKDVKDNKILIKNLKNSIMESENIW